MHKVGFTKAYAAVQKQRIKFTSRIVRNRFRRGKCKLIGIAHHEAVEGVFFIEGEAVVFYNRFAVLNNPFLVHDEFLLFEVFFLLTFENDFHVLDGRIDFFHSGGYLRKIILHNGVFAGRRVRQKNQFVFQKANGFQFGDPHFKAYCLNSAG